MRQVKLLAFDILGTVFDIKGSLVNKLSKFGHDKGLKMDWSALADSWINKYVAGVDEIRHGRHKWETSDSIIRSKLEVILLEHSLGGIGQLEKDQLNSIWHCLSPWPDSVKGLKKLSTRFRIVTLTNANISMVQDLSANAKLSWDEFLSAEHIERYKPDPHVYRMAINRLGFLPGEIMLVSTDKSDLKAAMAEGLKTAFIQRLSRRRRIWHRMIRPSVENSFHVVAYDFIDLYKKICA